MWLSTAPIGIAQRHTDQPEILLPIRQDLNLAKNMLFVEVVTIPMPMQCDLQPETSPKLRTGSKLIRNSPKVSGGFRISKALDSELFAKPTACSKQRRGIEDGKNKFDKIDI